MILGLKAVGAALSQLTTHFAVTLLANITVILLSIPLLLVIGVVSYATRSFSLIPLGVALLIAILPNPVTSGLQLVARDLAHGEPVYLGDQLEGFRRYGLIALRAWLFSLAITAILVLNVAFYASARFPLSGLLDVIWLYLLFTWVAAHLYVFPLLIEQEVKRILLVYRNAVLMTLSRPLITLVVLPFWLGLLLLCSATGLVAVIGLALAALIQHNATARVLPTFDKSAAR